MTEMHLSAAEVHRNKPSRRQGQDPREGRTELGSEKSLNARRQALGKGKVPILKALSSTWLVPGHRSWEQGNPALKISGGDWASLWVRMSVKMSERTNV